MDLIIKLASSLTTEEKTQLGITGIPNNWPIESYPYMGTVPVGFEQMTSEDVDALKANNQAAYDAWVASKRPIITPPPDAPLDIDNAPITRPKFAPFGWTYQYNCAQITTSKLDSFFHKNQNLTDYNHFSVKFYSDETTECVDQTDADSNCIKTILDWEPHYDYEIIGGGVSYYGTIDQDIRSYVIGVPDVPYAYGGTKVLVTNCNLRHFSTDGLRIDGRATKRLIYNASYHTSKLRFMFRHPPGFKVALQIDLELYIL